MSLFVVLECSSFNKYILGHYNTKKDAVNFIISQIHPRFAISTTAIIKGLEEEYPPCVISNYKIKEIDITNLLGNYIPLNVKNTILKESKYPDHLLLYSSNSVMGGGEIELEQLYENRFLRYDNFKKNIMLPDGGNWTKKILKKVDYPFDTIKLLIPYIKNDVECYIPYVYEHVDKQHVGNFSNYRLLYCIAQSLKKFTGPFSEDWGHYMKFLDKKKDGVYKLVFNVYT
jgi:hypothetical protein